jgi:hypothetical protein
MPPPSSQALLRAAPCELLGRITAIRHEVDDGDGGDGAGRVQDAGRDESAQGLAMVERWRVQLRKLDEELQRQLLQLQQLTAVQTTAAAVGPATSAAAAAAPGSPPRSIAAVLARRTLAAQLARAQRGAPQPEAAAPRAPVARERLEARDGGATTSARSWVERSTSPMRVAAAAVSEECGVRTASGSGRRIRVSDDQAALVVVCDGSGHWRKVVSAEGAERGGRGAEDSWTTRPADACSASIATENPLPRDSSGAHAKTAIAAARAMAQAAMASPMPSTAVPPPLSASHRFQWVEANSHTVAARRMEVEPGAAITAASSAAAPPVIAADAHARPSDREAARAALTARFVARSERAAAVAAAVSAAAEALVCGGGSSPSTLAALRWQLHRQRESLQRQQTVLREDTARRRDSENRLRRVPHVA